MLLDVRKVYCIQQKSHGLWLTDDLFLSPSFKQAGRCYDLGSAVDTGELNLPGDFDVVSFYELNQP